MNGPGVSATRQLHIDALARRAAQHQGEVRRVLEDKLQGLRAVQVRDMAAAAAAAAKGPVVQPGASEAADAALVLVSLAQRPSMAELLAHIARQTGAPPAQDPKTGAPLPANAAAAPVELKAIRDHRSTWSRLGAERRLHQALAKVPDNAGPLNTQRLLHQALRLMQDTSPAYLLHFMAHAESLLALDQVNQPLPALPVVKSAEQRAKRGA